MEDRKVLLMSNVPDFFNPNDHNQHLNLSFESKYCLRKQIGFLIDKHGFARVLDTLAMIIQSKQQNAKSLFKLEKAIQIIEEEGL